MRPDSLSPIPDAACTCDSSTSPWRWCAHCAAKLDRLASPVHPLPQATAQPKLGTDPDTVGYYGVAERDGKLTLLWAERAKVHSPGTGTRAAGQWWLSVTYRSMRAAEADLSRRNDADHYPARIVPPERVEGWAGAR